MNFPNVGWIKVESILQSSRTHVQKECRKQRSQEWSTILISNTVWKFKKQQRLKQKSHAAANHIQTETCEAFNTDKVSSESTCLLSVHCAPPCQGQINSSCSIGTCSIWCCMAYRHMLIYCRHRIDTYKGTWELKFVQCCRIWMWCGLFDYVHICLLFVFVLFSIALHIRLLF